MVKRMVFFSGAFLMAVSGYAMEQDSYFAYEQTAQSQKENSDEMIKQISFTFTAPYDTFGNILSSNESLDDLGGRFREFIIMQYPEALKFYTVCSGLKKQCEVLEQGYYPKLHTLLVTLEKDEPRDKLEKLLKDLPRYASVEYYTEDQSKNMRRSDIFESLKPVKTGCMDCVII
jgi:hypothetical protein